MAVIKDVANLAGLSVSVISKYLKNPDSVRVDTRERIESAITELDYVPSTQARALRTGKTGLISIISPNITNPFFAELFSAIQEKALAVGYTTILQTIPTARQTTSSVVSHPFAVSSISRVDGMIVCFPDEDEIVEILRKRWRHIPLVLLSWNTAGEADANLVVDLASGIYNTAKYLLAQGHTKIGYVGAPKSSTTSQEKQHGYVRALMEANLPVDQELIYHGPYDSMTGYQAAKKFWNQSTRPTSIITEADIFAVGCIKYCHQKQIQIPQQMAVTGFDDIPMAAMYQPPITTMRIPIEQMAADAVRALCRLLDEGKNGDPIDMRYETELQIRRSTDPDYQEQV